VGGHRGPQVGPALDLLDVDTDALQRWTPDHRTVHRI
jgi:hypothetical protein